MISESYRNLIEEADKCIPLYTAHLEILRKIMHTQTEAIEFLVQIDAKTDIEDFDEIERMNKFNALLTISLLDLMVVCKNMCLVETDWERIHFIKQGYLVIYETINTYHKYSSELRKIISTKYCGFTKNFDIINKDLKQFKKIHDYENVIGVIRNKVAGHIDEDFVLYYDIIVKLDGEKVALIISHFIKILTELLSLSKELAAHANAVLQQRNELLKQSIQDKLEKINELFSKYEKPR